MLQQNFKLFIRRMTRYKADFLISLGSLTIGLTVVLLAFLFIFDERGYDQLHDQADAIFRVNKNYTDPSGDRSKNAETPGLMAAALEEDFPEVAMATRVCPWFEKVLVTHEEESLYADNWLFADEQFFELFDFKMKGGGDPATILSKPGQILITPSLAKVLFGDQSPIGQTITGLSDKKYTVGGIVESPPRQSHLQYDVIASWASTLGDSGFLDFSFINNWLGQTVYTYIRLNDPAQMEAINEKLPAFTARYMPDRVDRYDFYLQPLSEVYLHSDDIRYLRGGKYGSISFVSTFSVVAFLILIIACFNYINITTARSLQRTKEVGVKKVFGAEKGKIVRQFLTETLWLTLAGAVISWFLAKLILPTFNQWFGKDLPMDLLYTPAIFLFLGAVVIITSLISGLFPGLALARFRPISMLRNANYLSPGGNLPRIVLTTLQLTVSLGLIAGALLLNQQFRFLLNRDLGFDKDQVMVVPSAPGITNNPDAFRAEMLALPGVESVTMCQATIRDGSFGTTIIPENNNNEELPVQWFRIDSSYFSTYGIELMEGRFLNRSSDREGNGVVVNNAFLQQMGWTEGIGKTIRFPDSDTRIPIVGIVKDFHYNTLHQPVDPAVMILDERKSNISVRIDPQQVAGLLPKMEQLWETFDKRYPFDFYFVDEFFAQQYAKEKEMLRIVAVFTILAIVISCLGLYGLIAFNVARKRKEVSIRKVLGASISNVFLLLTKSFFAPLLIALLVSIPASFYFLKGWLNNFAYRVTISWWIFAVAGLMMIVIMLGTVSIQSLRAASSNPVHALR